MKTYNEMNEYEKAEFDNDPWRPYREKHEAEVAARAAAAQPEPDPKVVRLITKDQIKPKPKPLDIDGAPPYHIIIAEAVIFNIRHKGEDLMFIGKTAYRYSDGLWTMETDGMVSWLNVEIEKGAKYYRQASTSKLINEARAYILRQDHLNRKTDVVWNAHGLVPTKSGLVNPLTGEIRPIRPDDFCTWRVETEYDPTAKCPWWLMMLDDVFADRPEDERGKTICVIQELLGAGLIDEKPRGLSKALVFQGGSNFGKSGLLDVLSGLFGREVNSTSIELLQGDHGLMPFVKRHPWVLHEAFDQRKWHFSSKVKEIVTGDPVQVNIKNGPMLTLKITAPIFWGTNHPPQFKESTKAVTNRLIVIECKREFLPQVPVGAAVEANRLGLSKPSSLVLRDELPGLLAWAMIGLKRALKRGRLVLTASMSDTIEEIRKDSNLVAGFLEECCHYDMDRMVSTTDFALAFSAWWQAEKGETYSPPSNEVIGKAVAAMADPLIATGRELRDKFNRYYVGIVLNDVGLSYHDAGADSRHLEAKKANTTDANGQVNKLITASLLTKPEVIAMRGRAMNSPRPEGDKF